MRFFRGGSAAGHNRLLLPQSAGRDDDDGAERESGAEPARAADDTTAARCVSAVQKISEMRQMATEDTRFGVESAGPALRRHRAQQEQVLLAGYGTQDLVAARKWAIELACKQGELHPTWKPEQIVWLAMALTEVLLHGNTTATG